MNLLCLKKFGFEYINTFKILFHYFINTEHTTGTFIIYRFKHTVSYYRYITNILIIIIYVKRLRVFERIKNTIS